MAKTSDELMAHGFSQFEARTPHYFQHVDLEKGHSQLYDLKAHKTSCTKQALQPCNVTNDMI